MISAFLAGTLVRIAAAQLTCYFPNGEVAEGNYPCDPSASVSVCCGAGGVCLDNKVCLANNQQTIRGACTDSSWTSPDCPQWCTGASTGGTDLISCQNVTSSPADYCCDHTNGCCDSGVGRFQILPSNPATSAIWIRSATAYSDLSLSTTTGTTTTTYLPTTTTAPPSSTTSTFPSTSTISSTPQSSGLSTAASAGIGVGVGAAVVLILGAIAFFVWRKSSKKHTTQWEEGVEKQDDKTRSELDGVGQRQELSGEREIAQASDIYSQPVELGPPPMHELGGDWPKR